MARKSPGRIFFSLIILVSIGLGVFTMFRSCSSDISPDLANVILETNGKKYLYSSVGETTVVQQIEDKQSPAAMADLEVYKDGDDLYVNPMNMKSLVSIMAGNVETHDYKEVSYDGYVTVSDDTVYHLEQQFTSTKKVGKQAVKYTLELTNQAGKKLLVIWRYDPSKGEFKAIKNCQVSGFWFQTNPQPGETVVSSEDFLVVPVKRLEKFFKCKVSYDRENKVMTVKR